MSEYSYLPPTEWVNGKVTADRYDALPEQVQADLLTCLVWCESYGRLAENEAARRLVDYFVPAVRP